MSASSSHTVGPVVAGLGSATSSLALVVQQRRPSPCPSCRAETLACPIVDSDLLFSQDNAEIAWHFAEEGRSLVSYFTYKDIQISAAQMEGPTQSSMLGTLFVGAGGEFSTAVFKILERALRARPPQLEVIYHCSLSRSNCVLGVRCLECGYCCSLAFSKAGTRHWQDLRGSLGRWLGVKQAEVPGSACYVHGQNAILRHGARGPPTAGI